MDIRYNDIIRFIYNDLYIKWIFIVLYVYNYNSINEYSTEQNIVERF